LLPVALLERPPERPGTLAVEIQIEGVHGVLVFQCADPYVKNRVVLAEAMKEEQGSKAVTGFGVMKAAALIIDEIVLDWHGLQRWVKMKLEGGPPSMKCHPGQA